MSIKNDMIDILNIKNVDQNNLINYVKGEIVSDYKTDLEIAREAKKQKSLKLL